MQDPHSQPASSNHDEEPNVPLPSPPLPSLLSAPPTMIFGELTTGANVEISQFIQSPPEPPPPPNVQPEFPDHFYCLPYVKAIQDRDKQIRSLQLQVKCLQNVHKRDLIKLQLARKKISKYENGDLPQKLKIATVHELLRGTFSKTLIDNLVNKSLNPKGKQFLFNLFKYCSVNFVPVFNFDLVLNFGLKLHFGP